MYQEFSIVSLIPKLEEKTIIAKTNFDIDKNSINSSTIVLLCKYDLIFVESRAVILCQK